MFLSQSSSFNSNRNDRLRTFFNSRFVSFEVVFLIIFLLGRFGLARRPVQSPTSASRRPPQFQSVTLVLLVVELRMRQEENASRVVAFL